MEPTYVMAESAPAPVGPYSQACGIPNGLLFLSGQTPIDPATGQLVGGGIEEQTARVFDNLGLVLEAAGSSWRDVVKVNVFLVDMDDFAAMNAVYARYVVDPAPARATVQVARLPRDVRIEVDAIAVIP